MHTNSDALLQIRDLMSAVFLDLLAEEEEPNDEERDIVEELTDIVLESLAFRVIAVDGNTISCTVEIPRSTD